MPPEITHFAKQVGSFIEYWGFKRVQGEFWAYLYVSSKPLTPATLMERTGVSKGLASIYLREMLDYGVIEVAGHGENGSVSYKAVKNQGQVIFNVLRKREHVMINSVQAALGACDTLPEVEMERHSISRSGLRRASKLVAHASRILSFIVHGRITGAICEKVFGIPAKELENVI